MYETFGFAVTSAGAQRFQLFIPDAEVDSSQYDADRGGASRIASIKAVGSFLSRPWDITAGLAMQRRPHPNGILWEAQLDNPLPEGFYEYKYAVVFDNGELRWVADPCAKLCGTNSGNSAFVVGGTKLTAPPPLPAISLSDVIAYEVMVDDATADERGSRAPIDVLWERLQLVLQDIPRINAVELMPITAFPDNEVFSWGYDPYQLFALNSRYVNDPSAPADRRARFAQLVRNCHERGVRVFMDIVLQHVKCDAAQNGFPYHFLWQDPKDSPFTGAFVAANNFEMQPLDYNNNCVLEFTRDVCCYWLETFGVDGLRFDQVSGFYDDKDVAEGAPALMTAIRDRAAALNRPEPLLMLEDTWGYDAVGRCNVTGASGCWLEPYRGALQDAANGVLSPEIMRALQSNRDFGAGKGPVIYIENHDHSTLIHAVGGLANWWKTQPAAIALFTSPGAVLIHNGQERGRDEMMWEDDRNAPPEGRRVRPRPIHWTALGNGASNQLASLYRRLAEIRQTYPALRSPDFQPQNWPGSWDFDAQGYGFNANRKVVIYVRGTGGERIVVALNFGDWDQSVDVPVPMDGRWHDVLNVGMAFQSSAGRLRNTVINSHWGRILVFGHP